MLKIHCPYCQEECEEIEFHCAGEAFINRPHQPYQLNDEQWSDYLFNHKGLHYEQWVHSVACRKYFIVQRDTETHRIKQTWRFDQAPKS